MSHLLARIRRNVRFMGAIGTLAILAASAGCAAADSGTSDYQQQPDQDTGPGGSGGSGGKDGSTDTKLDTSSDQSNDVDADGSKADALDAKTDGDSDAQVNPDAQEGGDAADAADAADAVEADSCADNPEICDGKDNNCNGEKDEGNPGGGAPCEVPGKLGECKYGTLNCINGALKCTDNPVPTPEICDNKDNNCDGLVDNNTTDTGSSCNTGLKGICAAGTEICQTGGIVCQQKNQPTTETCNGLDDNCDGTPDDGYPGSGNPCTVPGQVANTPCANGKTNCLGGQDGCTQVNFPASEVCDGKDNDCDGTIDNPAVVNNLVCATGLPGICATGKTQCSGGVSTCVPDVQVGTVLETCNNKDDDCNGSIDDIPNLANECGTKYPSAQNVLDWACSMGVCQVTVCAGAYQDCDKAPANGCEVNTLNDISHCGVCGKVCNSTHGSPSCNTGQCAISCNNGWGNCDGDSNNGCELPTTGDIDNCGACGKQCDSSTGTPTCSNSVCTIQCNTGLGNCDSNGANGCETSLQIDPLHCGTCSNACNTAGGTATCSGGQCGITCNPGAGNCNNNVGDGCEANLYTEVAHCGNCSTTCSSSNGTPSCNGGTCSISCASGYGDCDGNPLTGCEVNLKNSAENCNGCGVVCNSTNGNPGCLNGFCTIQCTGHFGNCNNDTTDGCETDIYTDIEHCGGCIGKACSTVHATPSCTNGVCAVACLPGYGDCDSQVSTGCETYLKGDLNNCGACGKVCSAAHGSPTCSNGNCTIACAAPYDDCDDNVDTGCEMNTNTNTSNCGQCGYVCGNAHGTASCNVGVCGITSCETGYANCDNVAANGCEIHTASGDVNNCGSCGAKCSTNHGTPSCSGSACSIVCANGYRDCYNGVSDGCETDILNDSNNCNACGNKCDATGGSPSCNNGTCGIQCTAPYADCTSAAGCETNTNTSLTNCGGCGHACSTNHATPTCSSGTCTLGCAQYYANCNNNVDDGCEVSTGTDVENCGACGAACSTYHVATRQCVSSACQLTCSSGWGNCNSNVGDGCETNTTNTVAHCGTCNHACSSNNGVAGCAASACTIDCNGGYGNCDGDITNGCETNTNTTVANCGTCGTNCNLLAHVSTTSCSSGNCAVVTCATGFGNCDALPGNGCEATLTTDVSNCGTCGHACSSNNGTPHCASSACTIDCNAGFANCNGNVADGCEINKNSDVNNCGACGNVCPSGNGTPLCTNGVCSITCAAGWGNCDGVLTNGCETPINTITNCGACNSACSTNNGTPQCVNNDCQITCNTGYLNCDGNARTNGCEVNKNTDVNNCNSCGYVCPTPQANMTSAACVSGSCKVNGCSTNWYDEDGTYTNGCECSSSVDSVADTCTNAAAYSVALNGSGQVTGNLTPVPSDTDWYKFTYTTAASCDYGPRVYLSAGVSSNVKIRVYTACTSGTPSGSFTCSDKVNSINDGITEWQFTYSTTCTDKGSIDPTPAYTTPFINTTNVIWVQVYSTGDDGTCQPYTLNYSN